MNNVFNAQTNVFVLLIHLWLMLFRPFIMFPIMGRKGSVFFWLLSWPLSFLFERVLFSWMLSWTSECFLERVLFSWPRAWLPSCSLSFFFYKFSPLEQARQMWRNRNRIRLGWQSHFFPSVHTLPVRRRWVCQNFFKGRKVTLPCYFRSRFSFISTECRLQGDDALLYAHDAPMPRWFSPVLCNKNKGKSE